MTETRKTWLAHRRTGIGGSDAGCCVLDEDLMPLSNYGSPYKIWLDKLGLTDESQDNESMEAGRALESVIRDWAARKFGFEIWRGNDSMIDPLRAAESEGGEPPCSVAYSDEDHIILRSRKIPFAILSPDGWCRVPWREDTGYLEIKNVSAWSFNEWHDQALLRDPDADSDAIWPPPSHIAQCQHAMFVSGARYAILVALFGGNKLRYVSIERDEPAIAEMMHAEAQVWRCVEELVEPEVDASKLTGTCLSRFPPTRGPEPILLPAMAVRWDQEIVQGKAAIARLERNVAFYENLLRSAIGDGESGILHDGSRYNFKPDRRGRRSLRRVGTAVKIVSKNDAEEIAAAVDEKKAS